MKMPSYPPKDGALIAFGMVAGLALSTLIHMLMGVY